MSLRTEESASIRVFLESQAEKFAGARVLDIGCGKQPYRRIVEDAGGTYTGMDDPDYPGSTVIERVGPTWAELPREPFDVVLMTQVWQYMTISILSYTLHDLARGWPLSQGGWLLTTGPTNWPVVEPDDLHRFTLHGVESLLKDAGFTVPTIFYRHSILYEGEKWQCGWAAVAHS